MKSIKTIGLVLLIAVTALFASCKEYGDDLRSIGSRVEALEARVKTLNSDLTTLQSLVETIEGRLYIISVVNNADGTHTLTFSDGSTKTIGNGANGAVGSVPVITVAKHTDGNWYWKVNGEWMDPMARANGTDGDDGTAGAAVVPQVRINTVTNTWEISIDNGATWNNTGVKADGTNGTDGTPGAPGAAGTDHTSDVFQSITVSTDGSLITFVLIDGTVITLPCV